MRNQARGLYFLSQSGLPWAMEVGMQWLHPLEGVDITDAYESFAEFAESSGKQKSQWFNDYSISNVVLKGEQ